MLMESTSKPIPYLYVNGEYIKADSISADKLKSKSITADKLNVIDLYALAATIAGWKINRNYISSTKDNIRLYSDGRIQIGNVIVSSNSNAMTVKNGMHVYYSTDEFGDGSGEFKLVNIHTFSSGAHLILGSNGTSVLKLSSSSKRYKDHIGYMSTGEAEKIADKLKSKSITADKLNVSDLYALAATIAGWKINRNYISSTKDNIRLYSDGRIQIGSVIVSSNSQAMTVKNGMHVYYSTDEFGDGSGEFKLVNIHTFSSGAHLILGSNGTSVLKLSSSSKRYKDHIGYMSTGEAEKILDIPVVWFKYKDGYLRSDDAFVGKPIPGFYAEDVEEHYPVAVQRNEDGSVEDWNYRTLIPAMLKMIQTMHSDIDDSNHA